MQKYAVISSCGSYRHILTRIWNSRLPLMGFIQLNPSIADHEIDDPTLRRDMHFARREGFGGCQLTNLYDFRATSPKELAAAECPVSDKNDGYICQMMRECDKTVAGYGTHKMAVKAEQDLFDLMDARDVLWCLGTTKGGMPRHPLYVKNEQPLIKYAECWDKEHAKVQ